MTSSVERKHSEPVFSALIAAAGLSSRMGEAKALMLHPCGETFVEYLAHAFFSAGCVELMVTLPENEKDAALICEKIKKKTADFSNEREITLCMQKNAYIAQGMIGSIWTFLDDKSVAAQNRPLVFTPVDLPYVEAGNVKKMVQVLVNHSVSFLVFDAQRGHPVAVSPSLFSELRTQKEGGARALFATLADGEIAEVEVSSQLILENVNDVVEYQAFWRGSDALSCASTFMQKKS